MVFEAKNDEGKRILVTKLEITFLSFCTDRYFLTSDRGLLSRYQVFSDDVTV